MHSNVAKTGKAGAKVVIAVDIDLMSVVPAENACGKRSAFPAEIGNGGSRIPSISRGKAVVKRKARGCNLKCQTAEQPNQHLGSMCLATVFTRGFTPLQPSLRSHGGLR
jgi:hypothetical protein